MSYSTALVGGFVVLRSSGLNELLGLADRIVVMHRGHIVETFDCRPFDKARVLARTTGANGLSAS